MSRSAKPKKSFQTLKGFKDILPDNQKYWDFVYKKCRQVSLDYGFKKLDLPILEEARLFVKGTGTTTDIIAKEFYVFEDKGGIKVALRPEFTPAVLRAYIEHGMVNQPQPVKLFSWGPVFRHDNPQAGRLRQFHQFNFEVIGSDDPETDSQLITMVAGLYKSFGFEVIVDINSIGCSECRPVYTKQLVKFLRKDSDKLCAMCQERLKKNPLRILDCKNKGCQELVEEAPQIIDFLCEPCKGHFMKVLENLDEMDLEYNLNPRLVRGLDYYTRTTFEIFLKEEEPIEDSSSVKSRSNRDHAAPTPLALGGGGRYDKLMEVLGGRPTPAIGFAGGAERVIIMLKQLQIQVVDITQADVFIAQLGDEAKKKCLKLFEDMRQQNIRIREAFSKTGLKPQLEIADKLGVKYTLILGQKEILDDTIIIRDMNSGIQEIVPFNQVMVEIKKRLDNGDGVKVYKEKEVQTAEEKIIPESDLKEMSEEKLAKEADKLLKDVEEGEVV